MSLLYDISFIIFSVLYFPYFLISGKWRNFSLQRLGIYPKDIFSRLKDTKTIWIHAVSVGEVMASAPLYEEIRKNYPSEKILISTVTSTGNRIALGKFKDGSIVVYLPLDLSFVIRRLVKIINPKVILIAETEVWPNLIDSLKRYGAKIVLFNGRISRNSFKRYRLITPILRRVLDKFDLFLMQSKADAEKIISLGAPHDRVKITGNLKYDAAYSKGEEAKSDPLELKKGFNLGEEDQLLMAGSTHNGEEEIVLRCYKDLINDHRRLRLLIAPRHIERADEIIRLVKSQGLNPFLVSQLSDLNRPIMQNEILILDVMGMLFDVYSIGEIIFVGGTLVKKGGQNPLEAAYHSKAIIFGPYVYNFKDITEGLLTDKAAILVRNEIELRNAVKMLLDNPDERKAMGERAKANIHSNVGAAKRNLEFIEALGILIR